MRQLVQTESDIITVTQEKYKKYVRKDSKTWLSEQERQKINPFHIKGLSIKKTDNKII